MINFLRISNRIELGDYLHSNGVIDNIASSDIIGVCVIPSDFLSDRMARFISMVAMDPRNKEEGNYTEEPGISWYYEGRGNYRCNFLIQRQRLPLDNNSDGVIDGDAIWGRVPILDGSNPYLTIDNPQDPGTRYFEGTFRKIPSPYALDGTFNPNFHYRGSEEDEWALTDYRGDLNTIDIIHLRKPKEKHCPAFYCCNKFSPGGYRTHGWYLPAIGELAFIPPRLEIIKNKMREAINAGSPGVALSPSCYWSSSEYSGDFAWCVDLNVGGLDYAYKDFSYYVRAFLTV